MSIKIIKKHLEQYNVTTISIHKSNWKCPECGRKMYSPEINEEAGEDLDGGTDICPVHGTFQVRHLCNI